MKNIKDLLSRDYAIDALDKYFLESEIIRTFVKEITDAGFVFYKVDKYNRLLYRYNYNKIRIEVVLDANKDKEHYLYIRKTYLLKNGYWEEINNDTGARLREDNIQECVGLLERNIATISLMFDVHKKDKPETIITKILRWLKKEIKIF